MSDQNLEREYSRIKTEWKNVKPFANVEEFCLKEEEVIMILLSELIKGSINSGRFADISKVANQLEKKARAFTAEMTSTFVMIGLDSGAKNLIVGSIGYDEAVSAYSQNAFPLFIIASKDLDSFVMKLIGGLTNQKKFEKLYSTIKNMCFFNCFRFGFNLSHNKRTTGNKISLPPKNPYTDAKLLSDTLWEAEMVADAFSSGGLMFIRTKEGWRVFMGNLEQDFFQKLEKSLDKNVPSYDKMGEISRMPNLLDELDRFLIDVGCNRQYYPMKFINGLGELFDDQDT